MIILRRKFFMAKKLLCVIISVLMVVSILPMGVFADDYSVVAEQALTSSGTITILSGQDFTDEDLYLYVYYTLDDESYNGWGGFSICDSSWANMAVPGVNEYTCVPTTTAGYYAVSLVELASVFEEAGSDVADGVILNWFTNTTWATLTGVAVVSTAEDVGVTHAVTFGEMENGTITADKTAAAEGATVTLTAVPDSGYECTVVVVDELADDGESVEVTVVESGVTYTFVMPSENVEVNAIFVKKEVPTDVDTSTWSVAYSGYTSSWGGWQGIQGESGTLTYTATVKDVMDVNSVTSVSDFGGINVQIWGLDGSNQDGAEYTYTVYINDVLVGSGTGTVEDNGYNATTVFEIKSTTVGGSYTLSATDIITATVALVTASEDEPGETGGETGGETETTTSSATRASGLIYVNEEYHGFLIVRNGTKHLACVPHTVDANGYCTVCKEYIGVDGDVATTEINGGEYVEAYSEDILFTSSGWGTYDLGDTALIDALSVEGSILVITRDRETSITFDDNSYEKFGLVDSWWSGDWMQLGTGGHTDADEESATIIDCISDDGVSVMYDGNTIYDAWVAAGMSNGGTATLITNTSGLYQITNVTVYVPAGSTTVEEVEVTEPQEPTDTETEEDGTDDVDVSETGTDDTADVVESNPTTGVVIALVPMAIAGLAVVASKRR